MANQFTQFGEYTGHVDLIDWDRAVLLKTGALYDEEQNEWYIPLDFEIEDPDVGSIVVERALVVYKRPEPTQVQHEVPQIALLRVDLDPDEKRIFSPTTQYRLPAAGSSPISVNGMIGYNDYESKEQERPYIFTYTIECWARYTVIAQFLLQKMMKAFPIRGTLELLATEEADRNVENTRTYLFFQEGIADLTELNSMVERIPGYSLTIRLEGELTLDRIPFTTPSFTGGRTDDPSTLPPGNPDYPDGNPDLPGGGGSPGGDAGYGNGTPDVRTTLIEDC